MSNLKTEMKKATFRSLIWQALMLILQTTFLAWVMTSCWNYLAPIYWAGFKFQMIPVFDAWIGIIFIRYGRSIIFKAWY